MVFQYSVVFEKKLRSRSHRVKYIGGQKNDSSKMNTPLVRCSAVHGYILFIAKRKRENPSYTNGDNIKIVLE